MYAFRKTAIIGFSFIWGVVSCSAQSLGEAAREQQALKKSTSSASKHVITNDDLHSGEHLTEASAKPAVKSGSVASESAGASADHPSAEEVKAGVKAQRQKIAQLEARMDDLQKQMEPWKASDCTHVLRPDNSNTCDIPQKLSVEIDRTKDQLEQEKRNLESMQEDARKMGYANSVYDPN